MCVVIFFCIDLFCILNFKSSITPSMLLAVMETSRIESIGFLQLYLPKFLPILLLLFLGVLIVYTKTKMDSNKICCIIIAFGIFGCLNWGYRLYFLDLKKQEKYFEKTINFFIPFKVIFYYHYCLKEYKKITSIIHFNKDRMKEVKKIEPIPHSNDIQNVVLIIGESLQRWHMGLYGYERATTPLLNSIHKRNLLVFNDVISPHAQTHLAIPKVLSLSHYENNEQEWYRQLDLLTLFKSIGYTTYWISSHEPPDKISPTSAFASIADVTNFEALYDNKKDGGVIKQIDRYIDNQKSHKKMFIIHLAGSHYPYDVRYPNEFAIFKDGKQQIDSYDNSVYFNDWVINQIFRLFSKTDSVVFYISDHAEDLYDSSANAIGHSESGINSYMVEIPMMVFCSDSFINQHQSLYQRLINARNRPYMTDDLIYTFMDLMGIEGDFFLSSRSVISDCFNFGRRRFIGGGGGSSKIIDYDTLTRKKHNGVKNRN